MLKEICGFEDEIKEIKTDNFHISRKFKDDVFVSITDNNVPLVSNFVEYIWFLSAIDVKHSTNFKLNEFKKVKFYEIFLFNGIIYKLSIYTNDVGDYWLHIKLDKNKLMSNEGRKWLDENNILFDGWFFKIPREKGYLISKFKA